MDFALPFSRVVLAPILISFFGYACLEAGEAPKTIYLERGGFGSASGFRGVMVNELVRQAFLIAAREELGLPTRDQALGEKPDGNPSKFSISVSIAGDAFPKTVPIPAENLRPLKVLDGGPPNGLLGTYYSGLNFDQQVFQRVDPTIQFRWGEMSPGKGVGVDRFSIRWEGFLKVPEDGEYVFATRTDDGVRLWVDSHLMFELWEGSFPASFSKNTQLKKGEVPIKMEFNDGMLNAEACLAWLKPTRTPENVKFQVAVFCNGKRVGQPLNAQLPWPGQKFYTALTELAEKWSREEFPAMLTSSGFAKAPANQTAYLERTLVEKALSQPDFALQFVALRGLHALTRIDKERDWAALHLAPTCALLSRTLENSPGAMRNIFAARGLLYAQRFSVAKPADRAATQAQAFVLALEGFPAAARAKWATAAKQGEPKADASWNALTEALLNGNAAAMKNIADDPKSPWKEWAAGFHSQLIARSELVSTRETALKAHLDKHNANPLLIDALTELSGIGNLHLTTTMRPTLSRILTQVALKELPETKQFSIDPAELDAKSIAGQRKALIEQAKNDSKEPSLYAFNSMYEADLFWQIGRRARFLSFELSAGRDSVKQFIAEDAPALEGTPFFKLLSLYNYDWRMQRGEASKELNDVIFHDLDLISYRAFDTVPFNDGQSHPWSDYNGAVDGTDWNLPGLAQLLNGALPQETYLNWLTENDPDGILTQVHTVRYLARRKPELLDAMAQRKDLCPRMLEEIASHYESIRNDAKAVEWRERLALVSPDMKQLKLLAEKYKKQGDFKKYVVVMEMALEQPDGGLGGARIRADLSIAYREQGEFKKALKYAEEAAQSGSHWAMKEALYCNEIVGEFDRAEEYARNIAQRYESTDSASDWYFFTVVYQLPNRKIALEFLKAALDKKGGKLSKLEKNTQMWIHWLEGEKETALKELTQLLEFPNSVDAGSMVALTETPEQRQRWLQVVLNQRSYEKLKQICEPSLAALKANQPLPAARIVEIADSTKNSPWEVPMGYLVGGALLSQSEQREAGMALLKKGLQSPASEFRLKAACSQLLRNMELKNSKLQNVPAK